MHGEPITPVLDQTENSPLEMELDFIPKGDEVQTGWWMELQGDKPPTESERRATAATLLQEIYKASGCSSEPIIIFEETAQNWKKTWAAAVWCRNTSLADRRLLTLSGEEHYSVFLYVCSLLFAFSGFSVAGTTGLTATLIFVGFCWALSKLILPITTRWEFSSLDYLISRLEESGYVRDLEVQIKAQHSCFRIANKFRQELATEKSTGCSRPENIDGWWPIRIGHKKSFLGHIKPGYIHMISVPDIPLKPWETSRASSAARRLENIRADVMLAGGFAIVHMLPMEN